MKHKLLNSIDSLPLSYHPIQEKFKDDESDQNHLPDQTLKLLNKYEPENWKILVKNEKDTCKAFSNTENESNLQNNYAQYSVSPCSFIDSSRIWRPLMPAFKGVSIKPHKNSSFHKVNNNNWNAGMKNNITIEPITRISIRDSSTKSRKSRVTKSSKSRSRSRALKNKTKLSNLSKL